MDDFPYKKIVVVSEYYRVREKHIALYSFRMHYDLELLILLLRIFIKNVIKYLFLIEGVEKCLRQMRLA